MINIKLSKKNIVFLCTVFCIFASTMHTNANTEIQNWYLQYGEHGQIPKTPDNGEFTEKYDVISLDRSDSKNIYLTFDAGYENGNVVKTLDVLKKHNITGAFFILPNIIKTNPELIIRMNNEGHLICNHTKSHKNMGKVTDISEFKAELTGNEDILKDALEIEMAKYYRPPEGAYSELNLAHAKQLGYKTVFWSLAYADWDNSKQYEPQKALDLLLKRLHPGCVLLLHPTSATNAVILEDFILKAKEAGYEFKSLDQFPRNEVCGKIGDYVFSDGESNVVVANRTAVKKVSFTFDDGPSKEYTEQILDTLKQYGVKATFFIIGKNAEKSPEILKKIFDEGHELGNHTYSHPDLRKISEENFEYEITRTQKIVYDITGYTPILFRPPGGYLNNSVMNKIMSNNLKTVLWSWRQDTMDWKSPATDSVINTVLDNVQDGDIILFHDYNSGINPTPEALKVIIPQLISRGYTIVTVSELING